MVAEAELKPTRPPALEPKGENAPPTTVTDTKPEATRLLSATELTLGAS
jgi:hypothetical protein